MKITNSPYSFCAFYGIILFRVVTAQPETLKVLRNCRREDPLERNPGNEGMDSCHAVVHYAEIGLKGKNRLFFERVLARNIARRMEATGLEEVERLPGRLLVHAQAPLTADEWATTLGTVAGIAHFAPAWVVEADLDALREAVLANLPAGPVTSFRIRASRADKSFPHTSLDIQRELGAAVQEHTGWPVRLRGAELVIGVEVLHKRALVTFGHLAGMGGLPVGTSGRVGLLLSGGIDSPVAGYLALKRGCRVIPIHFHSRPFGDWMGSEARAREIVRAMQRYQIEPYLYAVAIGRQQREITVRAPAALRVILYRRLMVRIARVLTQRRGGKALVTGESLGQVASQTLESLVAVEEVTRLPILRPLIGMDKQEIIALAERIGTLDLAMMKGDDCCQFLLPRKVTTRPRLADVRAAESTLEIDRLVAEALESARRIEIG